MAKPDKPPAEEIDGNTKTGRVFYWNGSSGWIKRDGVENLPTASAGRVSLAENFLDDIDTSEIRNGVRVSFVTTKHLPYIARSVKVIGDDFAQPLAKAEPLPALEPEIEETSYDSPSPRG